MPHIGNDIVDLKEPANVTRSRDWPFLKKILTAAEIEFVQCAQTPDQALWSFWACKETAYKIIKKSCAQAAFLPRQWQVSLGRPALTHIDGEVVIPAADKIYVRVFSRGGYVHCIGADSFSGLENIICNVEALPTEENRGKPDASLFLRKRLAQKLAAHLHLNPSDIKIIKKKRKWRASAAAGLPGQH